MRKGLLYQLLSIKKLPIIRGFTDKVTYERIIQSNQRKLMLRTQLKTILQLNSQEINVSVIYIYI
jgi:hypothetical protein